MIARAQRRLELWWGWVTDPRQRPLAYFAMALVLLVGATIAFTVHERQVERHQRSVAIALAIKVQHAADARAIEVSYQTALTSCRRGKALRRAVRTDAFAIRRGARAEYRFFDTAIRRATAQSKDPAVSPATRASAAAALRIYGPLQDALPVDLKIPPRPPNCLKVITDPNAPVIVAPQNP